VIWLLTLAISLGCFYCTSCGHSTASNALGECVLQECSKCYTEFLSRWNDNQATRTFKRFMTVSDLRFRIAVINWARAVFISLKYPNVNYIFLGIRPYQISRDSYRSRVLEVSLAAELEAGIWVANMWLAIPKPSTLWSQANQNVIFPLYLVFSVSLSFEL